MARKRRIIYTKRRRVGTALEESLMIWRSLIPALLFASIATATQAHDYTAGSIGIDRPWTRATPKNAPVAGGYLKITNSGTAPDRLIGGSVEVAKRFEIHEMKMDGGVMKMRELKDGLAIAPGASVELRPGSYHIMMMNLSRPLSKGEKVKGSLTFEKAGKVDVEFAVEAIGGSPAGTKTKVHGH
jgi:periplasmic copper chaperone A